MSTVPFPRWRYYPPNLEPGQWARDFISVVADARGRIDTATTPSGMTSNQVLAHLRPGLEQLGYTVESGKSSAELIKRPVLFGPEGSWLVEYQVDAVNDDLGVLVEVEAGRGARGNAVYRDLIRASLIVNADYFAPARHPGGSR